MATAPVTDDLFTRASTLGIQIDPLTVNIGAEISGVDLDLPLSFEQGAVLRDAWLRFKVVFFRDQDISHESHIRLGYLFGDELEGHPVFPHVDGHPLILRLQGVEGVTLTADTFQPFQAINKWHTDVTFRETPSIASLLRGRVIPPVGGDTLWADTAAAYAGLPQDVKDRIDGLYAEHDIIRSFGGRVTPEKKAELNATYPPQRHPVVRIHPETGEKVLYVNHVFTTRILEIDEDESAALLNLLFDRIKVPEYQVRFRWTPNAIAIWDNRSTQHYGAGDYWPAHRVLERVTVSGDVVEG